MVCRGLLHRQARCKEDIYVYRIRQSAAQAERRPGNDGDGIADRNAIVDRTGEHQTRRRHGSRLGATGSLCCGLHRSGDHVAHAVLASVLTGCRANGARRYPEAGAQGSAPRPAGSGTWSGRCPNQCRTGQPLNRCRYWWTTSARTPLTIVPIRCDTPVMNRPAIALQPRQLPPPTDLAGLAREDAARIQQGEQPHRSARRTNEPPRTPS